MQSLYASILSAYIDCSECGWARTAFNMNLFPLQWRAFLLFHEVCSYSRRVYDIWEAPAFLHPGRAAVLAARRERDSVLDTS